MKASDRIKPLRGLGHSALVGAVLSVLMVTAGCSTLRISQDPRINTRAFQSNPPRTLAILPFNNDSGVKEADEVAREKFYSALSSLGYDDVELEVVDSTLSRLGVEHQLPPDELPPPLIRDAGLADAILTADVVSAKKFWLLFYSHIKVKVDLKLVDTRTNVTLYENRARGINYKISPPLSIVGVVKSLFVTVLHLGKGEMEETFEEFSQKIVVGLPKASHVATGGESFIRDVKLGIPNDPLRAGQALNLEFHGTPGRKAFFDVGNVATNIPISEISRGRYGVRYVIERGRSAQYCVVACRLIGGPEPVEVSLHQQPFSVDGR